jgi:hypothetical protein
MSLSHSLPHDHTHAAMLIYSATRFIVMHQAEHLDSEQLVKRCCAHLMATTGITETAAQHYAMHPWRNCKPSTCPRTSTSATARPT